MATQDGDDCIQDDESYFDENGMDFHGQDYYFTLPGGMDPGENIKFRETEKFPFKVMVWVAISRKGRSQIYMKRSKGATNRFEYTKECIRGRLMPFIRKHYPDGSYVFWPDLASCHYANHTQTALRQLGVRYVLKENNPPNVPQLRPIETFWFLLKSKVYSNGWQPKTSEDLFQRIKSCIRTIENSKCEKLMTGVGKKVRRAVEHGVLSVVK